MSYYLYDLVSIGSILISGIYLLMLISRHSSLMGIFGDGRGVYSTPLSGKICTGIVFLCVAWISGNGVFYILSEKYDGLFLISGDARMIFVNLPSIAFVIVFSLYVSTAWELVVRAMLDDRNRVRY